MVKSITVTEVMESNAIRIRLHLALAVIMTELTESQSCSV